MTDSAADPTRDDPPKPDVAASDPARGDDVSEDRSLKELFTTFPVHALEVLVPELIQQRGVPTITVLSQELPLPELTEPSRFVRPAARNLYVRAVRIPGMQRVVGLRRVSLALRSVFRRAGRCGCALALTAIGLPASELPLQQVGVHLGTAPDPLVSRPAARDHWNRLAQMDLQAVDACPRVVSVRDAEGQPRVLVTAGATLTCVSAQGALRWQVFAAAPLRCPPWPMRSGNEEDVLIGGDDGTVSRIRVHDGSTVWRTRLGVWEATSATGAGSPSRPASGQQDPGPDRRIIADQYVASLHAVRGLCATTDQIVAAVGLLPEAGCAVVGVDPRTGAVRWRTALGHPMRGDLHAVEQVAHPMQVLLPAGRSGLLGVAADGSIVGGIAAGRPGIGPWCSLIQGAAPSTGLLAYAGEDDAVHLRDAERPDIAELIIPGQRAVRCGEALIVGGRRGLSAWPLAELCALAARGPAPRQGPRQIPLDGGNRPIAPHFILPGIAHSLVAAGEVVFAGWQEAGAASAAEVIAVRPGQQGRIAWRAPTLGLAGELHCRVGLLVASTQWGAVHLFASASAAATLPVAALSGTTASAAAPAPTPTALSEAAMLSEGVLREDGFLPRFSLSPATAAAAELAAAIAEGDDPGQVLVLGALPGDDHGDVLAAAIAASPRRFHVLADAVATDVLRRRLAETGLLGRRVLVESGGLEDVRFAPGIFDAVVARSDRAEHSAALRRLVRPCGGKLILPRTQAAQLTAPDGPVSTGAHFVLATRGALPGAGSWTHALADAGQSACSDDAVVRGPFLPVWLGAPGPRGMVDRHLRGMPPLAVGHRLIVPRDGDVLALNAYHGGLLWRAVLPGPRRLGMHLDGGCMAMDTAHLWIAAGSTCAGLSLRDGRCTQQARLPDPGSFGVVLRAGSVLLGARRNAGSAYARADRATDEIFWGAAMAWPLAQELLAFAAPAAEAHAVAGSELALRWRYAPAQGRCLIDACTLADASSSVVICLEGSADPAQGRTSLSRLRAAGALTLRCLDLATGALRASRDLPAEDGSILCSLALRGDRLVLACVGRAQDRLVWTFAGYDAATLTRSYARRHVSGDPFDGDHGEQNRRLAIIDGTVYSACAGLEAFSLADGTPVGRWRFDRRGHGCGLLSASAHALFWRGSTTWWADTEGTAAVLSSALRPGCLINAIPACGRLLLPEAAAGCSCGDVPLRLSAGYAPAW